MSEVGPNAINKTFVDEAPEQDGIMGDTFYCDTTIGPDGQLYIKGDICIHGNNWFATADVVREENNSYYYVKRASKTLK
jgi:hypothetical protein